MFVYRPKRRILRYSIASFTCKLSTVAGAAFVTQPSVDLTRYIGCKLTIDDGTQNLVGWIKAAGMEETLDVDLLAGFDFTSGWDVLDGGAITDANTYTSTNGGGVRSDALFTVGALYKRTYASDNAASYCRVSNAAGTQIIGATITSGSVYHTGITNYLYTYLRNSLTGTTNVATLTAQEVLTPSVTGVRIVSAAGGTTYNWTSNGGINPNATSFTATITSI